MAEFDVDFFVIGAGSGGTRAARIAATHGARVAIAEEFRIGGTCVIRGCVPKKLLVLASRFRDAFEDAAGFGWTLPKAPEFSWEAMHEAKEREITRLSGIYEANLAKAGVAIHRSRAVLEDAHTVRLADDTRVTAKYILIATGGHPVMPNLRGAELAISSNEIFDLPTLPRRLLVMGGGYIAVEFANVFHRLGSAVTLVYRGEKILRGFDGDLRDELMLAMAAEGVTMKMGENISSIEETADGCRRVTFVSGECADYDVVLFATGRVANTAELGLDKAGVKTGARGLVEVNDDQQTSVPHIYAVGDVTDRINLTPVAIREGQAVADSLFGTPRKAGIENVATAVFSTPEIGTLGLTEDQAREQMMGVDIYRSRFRNLKHTLTRRQERTFMKLVVDTKTDRVLGVHILGEDAGEMIQLAAVAVGMGATKADFDRTVAVHPSSAEELVTMREKVQVVNMGGA